MSMSREIGTLKKILHCVLNDQSEIVFVSSTKYKEDQEQENRSILPILLDGFIGDAQQQ